MDTRHKFSSMRQEKSCAGGDEKLNMWPYIQSVAVQMVMCCTDSPTTALAWIYSLREPTFQVQVRCPDCSEVAVELLVSGAVAILLQQPSSTDT